MLENETFDNLESTIQLVSNHIRDNIKKGGGIEYISNLPDLINSLANLVNASKH